MENNMTQQQKQLLQFIWEKLRYTYSVSDTLPYMKQLKEMIEGDNDSEVSKVDNYYGKLGVEDWRAK